MSQDAPSRDDRPREWTRHGRWLRYAVIAAYLSALALAPQWATLGFWSTPMIAEEADLQVRETKEYHPVSWETLAGFPYDFYVPSALEDASPEALAERNASILPLRVRALDGFPIAVRGYVIPLTTTRGRITEFILAAKNEIGCCFGDGLSMNQWILVEVPEHESFEIEPFGIATVLGRLEVGEDVQEGVVLSLYRMYDATVRAG